MKHHAFLACHPAVNLLYFVLVLTFSMFFLHPLCIAVSLCAALWCAAQLNGGAAVRRSALWLAPTALLAALVNLAFNHEGATILAYLPSGIPLTLVFGPKLLGDRSYYAVSLLMVLEAMLPFFLTFEGRKPRARELVVTAVLCALGVAGRAAFFMLPQCKPVLALTILAGAALGGETGFLVGAVTMLVSNILFSQGPWTPWQMLGMGLCGFLAGLVFHRGGLPRKREALCAYGAVSAFLVYGILLNAYSALLATGALTWQSLAVYCASGFAMDVVQAGSTAVFLWFFTEPMLDKLERGKIKYGFM